VVSGLFVGIQCFAGITSLLPVWSMRSCIQESCRSYFSLLVSRGFLAK
jgi:hypothetical protein